MTLNWQIFIFFFEETLSKTYDKTFFLKDQIILNK